MEVNNLKSFKGNLYKQIKESLLSTSEVIETEMAMSIQSVVYKAYKPKYYVRRRYSDGGLLSNESINSKVKNKQGSNNTARLEVQNIAKANREFPTYKEIIGSESQYLTPLIVYGHRGQGGAYSYGDEYPNSYIKPRDFISDTRRNIKRGSKHKNSLGFNMEDRGYDVKLW